MHPINRPSNRNDIHNADNRSENSFMASGIASTFLVPETMGRSLEDLSEEDQEGFVKGSVPTNFATHM